MTEFLNPLFFSAISLVLISVVVFQYKEKNGLLILLIGAFLLRLWAAQLSPFLHLWDEQFHALVAKNLANDWLNPILMPEVPHFSSIDSWVTSHVWLHKQPFFLWMIALSIKLFGATEFAVRFPTVIFSVLAVYGVYRIGKNLFTSQVGYWAAFLMTTSFVSLNLASGLETTDHNDAVFVALITCSFWFYSNYHISQKRIWGVLVGIMVGCAVLTKWLTGFLIFLPWFILLIRDYKSIRSWVDFSLAFVVSLLIFLPWQVYAYVNYTEMYLLELAYNGKHFFEIIEFHDGGLDFHFEKLNYLYFDLNHWFLVLIMLMVFMYIWKKKGREIFIVLVLPIVFVYTFFTIATTKMPLFTFMVSPLVYVCFGSGLVFVTNLLQKYVVNRKIQIPLQVLFFFFIGVQSLQINKFRILHDQSIQKDWSYAKLKTHEKQAILEMKSHLDEVNKQYVVFNTRPFSHPSFTFYTDYAAYDFLPSEDELNFLVDNGFSPIVLKTDGVPSHYFDLKGVDFYEFPMW
jgi:4-amino-4-deoxy-L-arabinose transferase-like glycosyltransferase